MWQLTVFSFLLLFHGHTSQPITDGTENGRQARQLDFGECCPCPGVGEAESPVATALDSSWSAGDRSLARARNLDDCTCRTGYPDTERASSIFFPTSMRFDGPVVRPDEKNEIPKPLLHPEVDLASSVLQTLREATDEEYQDALVRDAARSIAKSAEETIFGDSNPEASTGNIVTIIVSPKHAQDFDNELPQETHLQESHCIPLEEPPPLERTNMGKMTVSSKPPSLLHGIFGLPKINKPIEIPQRNLFDMDSSTGASDRNERVVHANDEDDNGKPGLRKLIPFKKLSLNNENLKTPYLKKNVDNDFIVNKVPNLKLLSVKNKLNDIVSSRSLDNNHIGYLPVIPKIKVNNSFSKQKEIKENLNLSSNNVQEQLDGIKSFLATKSHIKNIMKNTRPTGLKNLLKLKDVELIPLKDILDNAAKRPSLNRPKLELPAISNKGTDAFSSNVYKKSPYVKNKEVTQNKSNWNINKFLEHEVSPSNVIEKNSFENCNSGAIETCETDVKDAKDAISSTEVIDTVPSPSNIQSIDNCVINTLPVTEDNLSQTTENYLYTETDSSKGDKINSDTKNNVTPDNIEERPNEESHDDPNSGDCENNNNVSDAITDSSNIANKIVEPADIGLGKSDDSFTNKKILDEENCNGEQQESDNFKSLDSIPEKKIIKPLSLDKALSSIKENIIKKLEDLKKQKTITTTRDPNVSTKNIVRDDDTDNKESDSVITGTSNPDRQNEDDEGQENEDPIEITTLKPDHCNEELETTKESPDVVSMQDLQKISDSMLQQEEQKRESETVACTEPIKKVIETKIPLEVNSRETGSRDTEQSANSQNEVVMDPMHSDVIDDKIENREKKPCQNDLVNQIDTNTEASDAVINTVFPYNKIIESSSLNTEILQPKENHLNIFRNPLPNKQEKNKLEPLPTLEDIKLKLSSLFDKNSEDVGILSRSEEDTIIKPLNSIMATDASTSSFQSKFPPLRLEDINLDILQLKPHSSLLSKIPNIDLHSYRTKLPLPNDLRLKPIKLQSALEDNGSIFGATVTVGRNKVHPNNIHKIGRVSDNLWEKSPYLNDRTRMKTNLQKILNVPDKPYNLKNRLGDLSENSNILRKMQNTLESRINEATKNPINLQSHNLFEFISRNHEDVNDKLKAIHIDLNDRIETIHNNFKDMSKLGTSEPRSRNTNVKTFTGFSNRNKGKPLSVQTRHPKLAPRRESKNKNTLNSRTSDQQRQIKIEFPQKLHNQKKNKMSASASVPIPKIIEIPELKATLAKSLRPALQRTSPVTESSEALLKSLSNSMRKSYSPLGNKINPFKDRKIKVIFSTTPRSTTVTAVQTRKSTSSTHLQHSPKIHTNLVNSGIDSGRETGRSNELTLQRKAPTLEIDKDLKPKFLESPFIQKFKETIKTKLSKGNLPITLKKADVRYNVEKSLLNKNGDDMSRSASENTDVLVGQTLKENVSYKCRMVCNKE